MSKPHRGHDDDAPVKGDLGIDPRLQAKVAPLLQDIREKALRRGPDGIVVLSRALEERREARNAHRVTPEALRAALLHCGIALGGTDANLIVLCFRDAQGFVPIVDFCEHLTGKLNEVRTAILREIFTALDVDGNGAFEAKDLIASVDLSEHPKVKGGELTQEEAAQQLVDAFDTTGTGAGDGKVTFAEFLAYYGILSEEFAMDKAFAQSVRSAWAVALGRADAKRAAKGAPLSGTASGSHSMSSISAATLHGGEGQALGEFVPPKRVVGYTGHVPMAAERFGETFHRIEAATPELRKAKPWQQPTVPPVDAKNGLVRQGNKANHHSFKLA